MDGFQIAATVIFFTMMFGQGIISGLNITYVPTIYPDQRQAMTWIAANTEPRSNFVIVTGMSWVHDDFTEWFPAIAQRHSVNTAQGTEWLPNFADRIDHYNELVQCSAKTIQCVENWAAWTNSAFTYVVLNSATFNDSTLRQSLITSPNYELVYESANVTIFKHTDF